ncbi:MAG: protein kinase [Verrucomicrobiales bacterium]|nr:protein kinase [Verrucomicrobiales bacterium]
MIFSEVVRRRTREERKAFLDVACRDDLAARRRIERLLEAHDRLGGFMECPAVNPRDASKAEAAEPGFVEPSSGTWIGRYQLLSRLGEGGCGVVFMAQQVEPVRRRVALKVIKLGMDTRNVIARFDAERQALAMMNHPHIAKILDAGATENGRPYFVMELVQGLRITEFCDQHRLNLRERLDLFVQVCQAVQHAHQKGIIHRDLKPSNILVTLDEPGARGVSKVIDFGIAKATQGRLTDQTQFTAFEQFLGTPAYMSPEQAMMTEMDIDTRSDIYSLGVLLYELLTGRPPFDSHELMASGFEAMRRTLCETEPPRPSTRLGALRAGNQLDVTKFGQTEALRLIHAVRGDLDWIAMKCLEKDRARRYGTATALAADLQRFLNHEPVTARPPSRWYELQKTVRRHRIGFTAAAVVMVVLVAGALVSAREAMRARKAEELTRRTAYLADMAVANAAVIEGDLGTARALLRRYQPGPRETDLRDWEWRYLAQASEGDPHQSLVGHPSAISSVAFWDPATLVTTGFADWRTIVWKVESRSPVLVVTNLSRAGAISDLTALSRRRGVLIYRPGWRDSSNLRIVDLHRSTDAEWVDDSGQVVGTGRPIRSMDLDPEETQLAVASGHQVRLFNLDRRAWDQSVDAENGEATQGRWSSDGRHLVVGDRSGNLGFWSFPDLRKRGVLTNGTHNAGRLGFSMDSHWIADPGGDAPTRIWNLADRSLVAELPDTTIVDLAVFSPDGQWLALAGGDGTIRLWETTGWTRSRTLRGHTDPVTALAFSPDGRWLASGARNGELKLWRPIEEVTSKADRAAMASASKFQIAPDGSGFARLISSATPNGTAARSVEVWTNRPLQRAFEVPLPAGLPHSFAMLSGGRGVVLGGDDGSLRVVGRPDSTEVILPHAHEGEIYLLDASMDGSTLVTKGNGDWRVRLWRLPGLQPLAELPWALHIHGLKLSDDGHWLAGFSGPGDLGVWEVPSMKGPPMWRAVRAAQNVEVIAFSPDHRWLAAASPDGGAFLWDLTTHQRKVLPRALTQYTSLSFSPDGTRLAAGSMGHGKLLDVASGQAVLTFPWRGQKLAFALDGEHLLSVQESMALMLPAPKLENLEFDWLRNSPSTELPPYQGPNTNYESPDRPGSERRKR